MRTSSTLIEKGLTKLFGDRGDHEFRPIALEILERPPSPIALVMILTIALFFVSAVIWSMVGTVDIVALAQGKFQPSGRVKTVQPLETGRVDQILVRNGDHVKSGDVLVILDAREMKAEYDAFENAYLSLLAEAQRRGAAILSAEKESLESVVWNNIIPVDVRAREDSVLLADFNQIMAQLKAIDSAVAQKNAERERLQNVALSQNILVETLKERVALRQKLSDSAVGTRTALIDALETLHQQETTLVSQIGQLKETEEAIHSLAAERNKAVSVFIADNRTRAAEAKRNADDMALKLDKARVRLDNRSSAVPSMALCKRSR